MRGRVGQRADDLEQLNHRAGPAVRDDQRQRVRVRRPHVDEVDVLAVDLGLELRQRVQPRFARTPVVIGRPVAGELLDRGQLHALRPVFDQLRGGPARRGDAPPKVGDRFVGHVDLEGTDVSFGGHKSPPPGLVSRWRTAGPVGSGRAFQGHDLRPAPAEWLVSAHSCRSGRCVERVTSLARYPGLRRAPTWRAPT